MHKVNATLAHELGLRAAPEPLDTSIPRRVRKAEARRDLRAQGRVAESKLARRIRRRAFAIG